MTGYRQCPRCYQFLLTDKDFIGEHLKKSWLRGTTIFMTVRCGGSQTQLKPRRNYVAR